MKSLIVVSNRLPVSVKMNRKEPVITPSSGGLASALSGVKKKIPFTWIGWPGSSFFPQEEEEISHMLRKEDLHPVFLNREQEEHYYYNTCNSFLWPVFHYFVEHMNFSAESWKFYEDVNKMFLEKIVAGAPEGAVVWIHDFHLMLLPELLRKKRSDLKIGFFLHIPFPSYEVFRMIPTREAILEGLSGADHIGLHTPDYADHLKESYRRLSGFPATENGILCTDRSVGIGIHPVGMNPEPFDRVINNPDFSSFLQKKTAFYNDQTVVIGIERLDYTKGILVKINAFEAFLEKHPEKLGKIMLLQIVIPCRTHNAEYQRHRREIEEAVQRLNEKYRPSGITPLQYIYRSLSVTELTALYYLGDVCMITSIRDGMNLIAQEYAYCSIKMNRNGVLILSEFTGSAEYLEGAFLVNPLDRESMTEALEMALTLDEEEKRLRPKKMKESLRFLDSSLWAENFLQQLRGPSEISSFPKTDIQNRIQESINGAE